MFFNVQEIRSEMLGNTPESLFQLFKRSKRTLYTNLRFFCRVPISDCRPSRDISRSPQEPQHKTSTRQDSSLPQRLSRLLTTLPASRQEDYKIKPQQSLQIDVPNSETGTHSLTTSSSPSIFSVGENLRANLWGPYGKVMWFFGRWKDSRGSDLIVAWEFWRD